jgi:hypothetical protein
MSNLVSLSKLKNIAKDKSIDKYIKEIGYSKVKNKKYYVITIDNKKVNFGDIRYQDNLIHNNKERLNRFRKRFKSLYDLNKNNYNSSIFYSYNLLW